MKVLLFTDVHAEQEPLDQIVEKSKDCDVMVCCGDASIFGSGLKKTIKRLEDCNKQLFITHGNHEMISEMKEVCVKDHVRFLHKEAVEFGGITFAAYGGGGFSEIDERLEKWAAKLKINSDKKLVLFTHAPPYNTKLDKLPHLGHRGSKSVRKAIECLNPDLFASGHFHETFFKQEKIGKTLMINPGNEGTLIDL